MSDAQDAMTEFTGIASIDDGTATSEYAEEILSNLVRGLVDLKSPTVDMVTKNELEIPKDQENKTTVIASKNELKNQENGTEMEQVGIRPQEELMVEIHNKSVLEAPEEEEAITKDSPSDAQKMAIPEDMDKNANCNLVDARMESGRKAIPLTDSSTEYLARKDEVSKKALLPDYTDEQLEVSSKEPLPDYTDDENSNSESDLDATNLEMAETNVILTSDPVSDNRAEEFEDSDVDTSMEETSAEQKDLTAKGIEKPLKNMVGTSSEDSDVDTSMEETSAEQKDLTAKGIEKPLKNMVGTSSEDSDVDTSMEKTSAEQKYLNAKRIVKPSEKITEMIAARLNSEEFTSKLKEIDAMVRRLTTLELLSSPEERSLEEFEALEEHYNRQAFFEANFAAFSEFSESIAMKRKSKLTDVDEDPEECQVMPKKYKFSLDLDGRPFRTQITENSGCVQEQFRLAYEEVNDIQQSQKGKEYKFPITTGDGDSLEEKLKLCKNNFNRVGEKVVNAMSSDDHSSQNENDVVYESESDATKKEKLACMYRDRRGLTIDEFLEYGKLCDSVPSSAGTRISKDLPSKRQHFHDWDETNSANKGYFGLGKAFDSVKKIFLGVTFTGSLVIAMAVARVFGVTFPVPVHKKDNSEALQELRDREFADFLDKYYPLKL